MKSNDDCEHNWEFIKQIDKRRTLEKCSICGEVKEFYNDLNGGN